MTFDRRSRYRKSSRTLVITFLLGIGIGFSLCYAFLGSMVGQDAALEAENAAHAAEAVSLAEAAKVRVPPDREGLWPGRHLMVGISGTALDDPAKDLLKRFLPGAVLLREQNLLDATQTAQLVEDIKAAAGSGLDADDLPLVVLAQEHGPAFGLLGMDNAPSLASLGQTNDAGVAAKLGRLYGEALRNLGIGAVLGPVLDIYDPEISDPATQDQMFSSDKNVVAYLGIAFAEGLRDGGVVPVVRNYPGMGSAVLREDGVLSIEAQNFELVNLIWPFRRAATNNLPGMLVEYAAVPVIDQEQPTLPAAFSQKMVQMLLRGEFKYGGAVIAGDITNSPVLRSVEPGQVFLQAIAAGCDAVIVEEANAALLEGICQAVFEAAEAGALTPQRLEESKARLDQWRTLLEKTPAPEPEPVPSIADAAIDALGKPAPVETPETEHVVKPGESLTRIAKQYGVTLDDLAEWNQLKSQNVQVGQKLVLRLATAGHTAPETAPDAATPLPPETVEGSDAEETAAPEDAATAPGEEGEMVEHAVRDGETLATIARDYAVTEAQLKDWNQLGETLPKTGQVLLIYPGGATVAGATPEAAAPASAATLETYTVAAGDSLRKIADKFHTTPEAIIELNSLKDANTIIAGQSLVIPPGVDVAPAPPGA
ncbi:MAG: LysM peptidoglycan-binding domain-containing protein [Candidatus Hydrogenedentes bacterium]|nr:LysM peptidoglycan-binding domain-containing protein [Candidatus Hydrogenedentota bacterium]